MKRNVCIKTTDGGESERQEHEHEHSHSLSLPLSLSLSLRPRLLSLLLLLFFIASCTLTLHAMPVDGREWSGDVRGSAAAAVRLDSERSPGATPASMPTIIPTPSHTQRSLSRTLNSLSIGAHAETTSFGGRPRSMSFNDDNDGNDLVESPTREIGDPDVDQTSQSDDSSNHPPSRDHLSSSRPLVRIFDVGRLGLASFFLALLYLLLSFRSLAQIRQVRRMKRKDGFGMDLSGTMSSSGETTPLDGGSVERRMMYLDDERGAGIGLNLMHKHVLAQAVLRFVSFGIVSLFSVLHIDVWYPLLVFLFTLPEFVMLLLYVRLFQSWLEVFIFAHDQFVVTSRKSFRRQCSVILFVISVLIYIMLSVLYLLLLLRTSQLEDGVVITIEIVLSCACLSAPFLMLAVSGYWSLLRLSGFSMTDERAQKRLKTMNEIMVLWTFGRVTRGALLVVSLAYHWQTTLSSTYLAMVTTSLLLLTEVVPLWLLSDGSTVKVAVEEYRDELERESIMTQGFAAAAAPNDNDHDLIVDQEGGGGGGMDSEYLFVDQRYSGRNGVRDVHAQQILPQTYQASSQVLSDAAHAHAHAHAHAQAGAAGNGSNNRGHPQRHPQQHSASASPIPSDNSVYQPSAKVPWIDQVLPK